MKRYDMMWAYIYIYKVYVGVMEHIATKIAASFPEKAPCNTLVLFDMFFFKYSNN